MDFQTLENYLKKYVPFTQPELEAMYELIEIKDFEKHEKFINEGQIARHIAFSVKGYFRAYIIHNEEEITRDITPLNSFFTALPSFSGEIPSFEIFEAITPAKVLIISKKDLELLYNTYPKWERFGRLIIEEMFINLQYRLYLFITQTAEQRYIDFMKKYPDIIQNVPLGYIASFLGIKQQSLSRLRKKIIKKNSNKR